MITQTDLYRRLKAEVDRIPAIDTHVHLLELGDVLAPNLSDILQYHNYLSEVTGTPANLTFNADLSPRDRVRAVVPMLKGSSRSTHAWMLREVLRQVYGFQEELTLQSCDRLLDTFETLRRRPGRLKEVLSIAGVAKVLIHLPPKPVADCGMDDSVFVGLSSVGVPPLPDRKALDAFEKQTGVEVRSARSLRDATVAAYKRCAAAGQVGVRTNISPGCIFRDASDAEQEAAFTKAATGKTLSAEDRQILNALALDATMTGAAEARLTVQVFFARGVASGVSFPLADPCLLETLAACLARHPKVNFEIYTVVESFTQQLCVLAKYRRNCHLGGCWWLCQFPEIMSRTYALRLEMIPASKWVGFFSDAYVAEWVVGKMALARKELTKALALKVVEEYITEEDAVAIAREVLFETPRRLYHLRV